MRYYELKVGLECGDLPAVDVHVLAVVVTLPPGGPGPAVGVVVPALVLALHSEKLSGLWRTLTTARAKTSFLTGDKKY